MAFLCLVKLVGRVCILIIILFIAACARRDQRAVSQAVTPSVHAEYQPDGARLTSTEATRLAKQEAVRHGVDLRQFNEPLLNYNADRTNWFFLFWSKFQRYPGDHFSVYVHDHTKKSWLIGGR